MSINFNNTASDGLLAVDTPITAIPFTMACWVKTDQSLSGVKGFCSYTRFQDFRVSRMSLANNGIQSYGICSDYALNSSTEFGPAFETQVWTHVCLRVGNNGVAGAHLWVAGVFEGSFQCTDAAVSEVTNFFVGNDYGANTNFKGSIGEVVVYTTWLSNTQIQQLAVLGSDPLTIGSPVRYWSLVDTSLAERTDKVGGTVVLGELGFPSDDPSHPEDTTELPTPPTKPADSEASLNSEAPSASAVERLHMFTEGAGNYVRDLGRLNDRLTAVNPLFNWQQGEPQFEDGDWRYVVSSGGVGATYLKAGDVPNDTLLSQGTVHLYCHETGASDTKYWCTGEDPATSGNLGQAAIILLPTVGNHVLLQFRTTGNVLLERNIDLGADFTDPGSTRVQVMFTWGSGGLKLYAAHDANSNEYNAIIESPDNDSVATGDMSILQDESELVLVDSTAPNQGNPGAILELCRWTAVLDSTERAAIFTDPYLMGRGGGGGGRGSYGVYGSPVGYQWKTHGVFGV